MKKLLIAAAIVCAAAVSQAAAITWATVGKAYGPADLTTVGHCASGTASSQYMKNQTKNEGIVWAYSILLSDGVSSETLTGTVANYSSNKIAESGISSELFSLPTSGEKTYSWEIVITGASSDGKYTYTSDKITGSQSYTSLSTAQLTTAAPSGWTVAAVPEPTSALLILLGMAGLALKRKHA